MNPKESKKMVFDAFMLPYGCLFKRREEYQMETKLPLSFDYCLLVINQYFLSEMEVVENNTNWYQ